MKQLTLRGFDRELAKRVRALAKAEGISLNRAALRLLRRGAGLEVSESPDRAIGHSMDHYMGTWSDEQAKQVSESSEEFERIDPEFWK